MRSKLVKAGAEQTFVLIFEAGDEFMAGMRAFAQQHHLDGASFTAIGAFSSVTLGYFERERKDYKHIPIDEQVEVLSLIGNIATDGDAPQIHAHVVLGTREGMARGGHLLQAQIWPTLEAVVVETPAHLRRVADSSTGLALIRL